MRCARRREDGSSDVLFTVRVRDSGLARIARHVPAKHFQAFDLYARQQWPVLRVARELGVNPASGYLISHRLTKRLKAEVARLEAQLG